MPRSTPPISVSAAQKKQMEQWLAAQGTPQQVALRCRIVLSAEGGQSEGLAAERKSQDHTPLEGALRGRGIEGSVG
ncbi:MAG: hypothetical protein ACJ746_10250, partial [Bryobacteraceae bacterium]